ncbi:MAG TPA: DUF2283 domain-containing protein [Longimicrobium sp.]|nr:DUF2283 domain-containing protein [Longimicrobium sp.]
MVDYESALRATIRRGRRIQDPEKPQKFFYQLRVPNLPEDYTHIEAVVLFRIQGERRRRWRREQLCCYSVPGRTRVTTMPGPEIFYDEPVDTLYLAFFPGEKATGLRLNNHIVLRVDKHNRRAIGITVLDFSMLAGRGGIGPHSYPLTELDELKPEPRELALELLHSPPVSDYLTVVACPPGEILSVMVNTEKFTARAA